MKNAAAQSPSKSFTLISDAPPQIHAIIHKRSGFVAVQRKKVFKRHSEIVAYLAAFLGKKSPALHLPPESRAAHSDDFSHILVAQIAPNLFVKKIREHS